MSDKKTTATQPAIDIDATKEQEVPAAKPAYKPRKETGGPTGLEPTRYGDWERKGICVDF